MNGACTACGSAQPPVVGAQGWPVCPSCGNVRQAWTAQPPAPNANWGPPGKVPGAVLALVMGIIAFFTWLFGIVFAVLAIVFGVKGRKAARQNPHLSGGGMATAGMVLGIVYLALVPLVIVLAAMTFVLVQNLGDGLPERAPLMGFAADHSQGTITVINTGGAFLDNAPGLGDEGLGWRGHCGVVMVNGDPVHRGIPVMSADVMQTDCGAGDTIELVHRPTGRSVFEFTFR